MPLPPGRLRQRLLLPAALVLAAAAFGHALHDAVNAPLRDALWAMAGAVAAGGLLVMMMVRRRSAAEAAAARASAAEHRLAEAIGTIEEGFALFDADDRLVVCNEPFRRFYAMSGPIPPGIAFRDLLLAGAERGQYADCNAADPQTWIAERLRHHRIPLRPLEQRLGNGRWLKVNERRTADGGFVAIHTDITELKRREEELRESEERFRKLSDAATDAIVVHENGIVVDANRAAAALVARPTEELVGMPLLALVAAEDHDRARERLANRREGRFEITCRRPDGTRRIVEGETRHTTHHGRPVTIVSAHDITAHRQAEAQLRLAKEQAEQASQAKSDFLRMISHELRTPLNGVLGTIGLLLDGPLGEDQRLYAQTARESGEVLLTILNDILDLSKMEAGKLTMESNRFSPVAVVESVVSLLAARATAKGIALAACVPGDLPPAVRGDAGRLRQVLLNLAGNAVKFTEAGGVGVRVAIDADTADPQAADPEPGAGTVRLRFEVHDTGIGIPPEAQPSLFTEFTQVAPTLSRRYGGTGLGLAISKRLVEAMGGTIGFDSAPGRGSRFWFVLPFDAVPGAVAPPPPLAGRSVLLVDAEPVSRRTMADQLRSWGAAVTEAGDAAAARAAVGTAPSGPDTALIDTNAVPAAVPGAVPDGNDGLAELLPALRRGGVRCCVLMALVGHAPDARNLGLAAVLVKPVLQARLLTALGADGASGPPARAPAVPAGPASGGGAVRRILLAEDSPTNQLVAVAFLRAAGYQVDVAANGLEAVEAARTLPYDLILMDIAMPEMDGLAATRALRAMPPPAGTLPIVAMTADAMEGDRERCLAAGMNDHIAKPVDRAHLLDTVARWLAAAPGGAPEPAADGAPGGASGGPRADTLDEGVLDQLAADIDPDLLGELVRQFVGETRAAAARIADDQTDRRTLLAQAHTLKSTAATFGATRLSARARALELACRADDAPAIAAARRDVTVLAVEAEAAYRARGLLDGEPAADSLIP
ncbi:response regulator [Azospirillum halopraeferens]|uniref:response regulator n=1 Tax=Azospirillum halopraeferens TaxID=34010 RepID=UPI0006871996|nr:response regulator [Azospirillum halopraeferens]